MGRLTTKYGFESNHLGQEFFKATFQWQQQYQTMAQREGQCCLCSNKLHVSLLNPGVVTTNGTEKKMMKTLASYEAHFQ